MLRLIYTLLFLLMSLTSFCQNQKVWYDTCVINYKDKSYTFSHKNIPPDTTEITDTSGMIACKIVSFTFDWKPVDSSLKKINIYGRFPSELNYWSDIDSFDTNGKLCNSCIFYKEHRFHNPKSVSAYLLDSIKVDSVIILLNHLTNISATINHIKTDIDSIKLLIVKPDSLVNEYEMQKINIHFIKDVIKKITPHTYLILELYHDDDDYDWYNFFKNGNGIVWFIK